MTMTMVPFETTRDGVKIGYVYAPTPGQYRGLAEDNFGHPALHAVCPHEHTSEQAAMRCARLMTKVARS